tara:strand:+ start:322 stop:573 length:252 start_codon:yes stop_codon:yes gene_type:complete
MNNRSYIVINLSDTDKVLFSQVNQSSAQSMRRNLANTQGILSYSVTPSFVSDGSLVPVGDIMNQSQCIALLADSDWTPDNPET